MKPILLFSLMFYSIFNYAINPKKEYISTPKEYNIQYKEVIVKNNDVEICAWVSEPNGNKIKGEKTKTVLLAYGDYGNMSYYLPYISFYTKLGFRVISFDYRGFGKSSSFQIDSKRLFYEEFSNDMKNVLAYFKRDLKIDNIGIVALSMGTIATVLAVQDEKTEFIIAEGCVYDVNITIERLEKAKQKEIISNSDYELPKKWQKVESKILIFVAKNDIITNLEDGQNIVSQNVSKRMLIAYEGDHLGMLNNTSEIEYYEEKINRFVNGN
ncbi:alpha/beta hydrolase family protein [Flavobacterium soyae]|uniref:alpha/beta hydrolase family protein n=1 Tax=Flavobacterium soyae TaxID=2903098 RepID=UPI001E53EFB1|nr:alpha/beta fold hydrolase [Flavobacterium soyae]MCD9576282.1 alpha/beta hydrolase [Flavobacterium soyae]